MNGALPSWLQVEILLLPIIVMLGGALLTFIIKARTNDELVKAEVKHIKEAYTVEIKHVEDTVSIEIKRLEVLITSTMSHLNAVHKDFDRHAQSDIEMREDIATIKAGVTHLNKAVDTIFDMLNRKDTGAK